MSQPDEPHGGVSDQQLFALVREAAQLADPVPPGVLAAAKASLTWLSIDADLASLVEDTAGERKLTGVRSGAGARLLTFEGTEGDVVLVEVAEQGRTRRLTGQLVPARALEVQVRRASGASTVRSDDLGRFVVDDLVPGPVSLACRPRPEGPLLVTAWTVL